MKVKGNGKGNGKGKGKERRRDVVDKGKGKTRVVDVHRWDSQDEGGNVDGDETEVEVDMYGRTIEPSARIRDYRSCSPPNRIIVRSPSPASSSSMRSTRFNLHLPDPPHGIHVKHLPEQEEVTTEVMEEEMPPKLRKRWIHKEAEALKGASGAVDTAAAKVQNITENGVVTMGLGIVQTGLRAVIRSKEEQEMPLPPPGVVAVPTTSPSDSFAKLSLRSPAILTSGTHGTGRFAVVAAHMESPMHSWSPFKRVEDVSAGEGQEVSEDVLRDGQAEPTSKASIKSPSKHSPPMPETTLPVSPVVSVEVLYASPPHLLKQPSSPETTHNSPLTLRANARPSFKLTSSAMSIHSLLSPSPSLGLSPKPSLSSVYAQEDTSIRSSIQPSPTVEENPSQRPPSPPLQNQFDRIPPPSVIQEGNENAMDVDPSPLIPELKLRSHDTLQMEQQQQQREHATMVSQPSTPTSATSHPVVKHAVSSPLSPPPPSSPMADMRDSSQPPTTPPTHRSLSMRTALPPLFSVATPLPTIVVSASPPSSPSSRCSVIRSLSPVTAMTSSPVHQTQTLTTTLEHEGPPPASAESPPDRSSACSPSPDLTHYPPYVPGQSPSAGCVSPRLHVKSPSPSPSLPPASVRPPSPAPAPKVKMSLKDFAMRKKKMREEGLTKSIQASPMSTTSALGTEMDEGGSVNENGVASSDTAQDAIDAIEVEEQTAGLAKSHIKPAQSTDDEVVKAGDIMEMDVKCLPASLEGLRSASPVDIDRLSSVTTSDAHSIFVTASVLPDAKMDDKPHIQISKPAEPTRVNGHPPFASSTLHNSKTNQSDDPVVVSAQPKLPPPLKPAATKEAKAELIEDIIPPESASTFLPSLPPTTAASEIDTGSRPTLQSSAPPSNILAPQPPAPPPLLSTILPSPAVRPSQVPPPPNTHPRQFSSQEEGEISHVDEMPFARRTDLGRPRLPRSSPPTQPRLFHATTASSPLPIAHGQQTPYQSPGSSHHSSSAPRFSRPIPSAPRALRNSALFAQSNQPAYTTPPPNLPARSYSGSHYTPRGPSADRDYQRGRQLEWDREDRRQFRSHSKMVSKGGGGSGSWNR
ncbi:hypothetical protein BDQ12DRAFT_688889 [Crucibulum laeve]|uniref:Uncharacterized protein n=1 Tax=Crucibulum laeve TaxID=68775 RepID=A0A5C3LQC3_9AGAR|nr:hypothetical protein BDQ12DRAFT_688889 [Crucibulum laeve]